MKRYSALFFLFTAIFWVYFFPTMIQVWQRQGARLAFVLHQARACKASPVCKPVPMSPSPQRPPLRLGFAHPQLRRSAPSRPHPSRSPEGLWSVSITPHPPWRSPLATKSCQTRCKARGCPHKDRETKAKACCGFPSGSFCLCSSKTFACRHFACGAVVLLGKQHWVGEGFC